MLWAIMLMALPANAQRRISGTVSDDIDVIIGANVKEVDKNNRILNAVVTDFNGNFTMTLKDDKSNLVVSYMGYKTVTVSTAGKTVFKIHMEDNTKVLKDVVVTAKKMSSVSGLEIPEREFAGAVQKFDMANVEGLAFTSVDEALQGQIAGLDITMNSGNAGAGTTMRLRGTNTLNGDANPLLVVNGDIFDPGEKEFDYSNIEDNEEEFSALLNVNPEDIESVTVLKGATAAKYGSKGSAGVIEIKLKRGKRGKTLATFSYKFSGSWSPDGYRMLNGDEYTMFMKEALFNPEHKYVPIPELEYNPRDGAIFHNYNKNTDWRDAVTRFSKTHDYYVTLSGGGEKATFRIGAGYMMSDGTVINQDFNRFSTMTALDYWVSDRIKFSSTIDMAFATRHNNSVASKAFGDAGRAMPNMSIYAYDKDGAPIYDENGERKYFIMYPLQGANEENNGYMTSRQLQSAFNNGNPVAYANLANNKSKQITLNPKFSIDYKLLGKNEGEWQLNYQGTVRLSVSNNSDYSYTPASLKQTGWQTGNNSLTNSDYNSLTFLTRHSLYMYSGFKNTKHSLRGEATVEVASGNSSSQYRNISNAPDGVTDPTVPGVVGSAGAYSGSSRSQKFYFMAHYSYASKYSLTASLTIDGNNSYGKANRFGYFPTIGGRWNISDEPWMNWATKKQVLSMLGVRGDIGITGNGGHVGNAQFNTYTQSGEYIGYNVITPDGLALDQTRWEQTLDWNIGFNLGLFSDMLKIDGEVYGRRTKDLIIYDIRVPAANGFSSVNQLNDGVMYNKGWDIAVNTGNFAKIGKFSMRARINFSQNFSEYEELNSIYLERENNDEGYQLANEAYPRRLQIGNAPASIYGLRHLGVYKYDYDHNGHTLESWSSYGYNEIIVVNGERRTAKDYQEFQQYIHTATGRDKHGNAINTSAAAQRRGDNFTCPIAYDKYGNMLTDYEGNPMKMYYCYNNEGGTRKEFTGGDVIYEDVNKDGQIDKYDMVYLGNSNPSFYGGGGLQFFYDKLSLNINFSYRVGSQVINLARMQYESMSNPYNQSYATTWRWRKNGDETEIPRALNASNNNTLPNDRYVENADYLRINNIQLRYSMDPKKFDWMKKCGIRTLSLSASMNNVLCLTKYTGLDPEISGAGATGYAIDNAKTPRAKSFTCSVNIGF